MELFYWFLALMCISAAQYVSSETLVTPGIPSGEDAKFSMKIARHSIQTADKILDLFNNVDQQILWTDIKKQLRFFDEYFEYYTEEAATLVGNVKTNIMNGVDEYFEATLRISEWCSLIMPLLKTHHSLFTDYGAIKAAAQNRLMQKVLGDGVAKMTLAQTDVAEMLQNFNASIETIFRLIQPTKFDIIGKTIYIAHLPFITTQRKSAADRNVVGAVITCSFNLYDQVNQAMRIVNETVTPLKTLIADFEELKAQSERLTNFERILADDEDLRDAVRGTTESLITKCSEFDKNHKSPTT